MHRALVLHFLNLLKLRHPTCGQVTVLEADPVASLLSCIDHLRSYLSLTLTKRKRLQPLFHTFLLRQLDQVGNRISTRRQNENDRRSIRRVDEGAIQVEWRALNELLAKHISDVLLNSLDELFFTENLDQHELLEWSEPLFEGSWQRQSVRFFRAHHRSPIRRVIGRCKTLGDVGEIGMRFLQAFEFVEDCVRKIRHVIGEC